MIEFDVMTMGNVLTQRRIIARNVVDAAEKFTEMIDATELSLSVAKGEDDLFVTVRTPLNVERAFRVTGSLKPRYAAESVT